MVGPPSGRGDSLRNVRYALVIALVLVLLMAATLVTVSVLMLSSGRYPATGHVGRGALDPMTAPARPSPFGSGLLAEATANPTPTPPLGLVATIPLPGNPTAPVYDPLTGDVYIAETNGNVSVLNGSTLIGNLTLSNPASSITVDSKNGYLYVMGIIPYSADRGVVEVVADGHQIATISTYVTPSGLFDARNGDVYVSSFNLTNPAGRYGVVTVLKGSSVLASFTVGPEANLLAVNGQTGEVYVATGGENVTVLNGTSSVGTISMGMTPDDAVYDTEDGYAYFSGLYSESITVVQGTTIVGTIAYSLISRDQGLGPVDPRTGDLYVNLITNVSVVRGTSILATFPIFRVPYVYEFEEEATYDSLRGVVEVIDSEEEEGGTEPDEVQLFNGTAAMGNLSLGVSGVSTGAVYDSASGDTYVTTGPSCLESSCSTTARLGYEVILGTPSAPAPNAGSSAVIYVVIAGVGSVLAFAAIAWVLWIRRRRSTSR